jgi:cold-inducible RNA-binding protein
MISAGRLDSSRVGLRYTPKPLFNLEHPNLVLRPLPFRRSHPIRSFFYSQKGERYIYMSTKLYVGNLSFQTTSQELQELFGQAGTVQSASVVEDRDTGRSRGFAFIEMSSEQEATSAIEQFNGKEVNGRSLTVNEAKPRENRGGGGRGFSNNRGGNNRGGFGGNRGGNGGRRSEPRW